ncbi:MAG: L,D-transpeptidase [Hyphomicrobium sp.]
MRKAPARSIALVVAGLLAPLGLPGAAHAQSLIDFLWGGSPEYGGGRQTVSFNKQYAPGQVVVSFGDRRVYLVTKPGQAISYPIAVPREQSRWSGVTTVSQKRENPAWTPTPEMIRENPRLPRWVPGGHPMNPLGVRALYLGSSTYRIHGTDAPWTIGQAVSKGCIRMFNEDVLDLYPRVPVGTKVTVTWNRFNTAGLASADPGPVARSAGAGSSAFSGFFGNGGETSRPSQARAVNSGRRLALPPSAPRERRADAE